MAETISAASGWIEKSCIEETMRMRARFFLRLFLLTLAFAGVGAGQAFTPEPDAQAAVRAPCADAHKADEKKNRHADWGWNVFGKGSGSPIYRM